VPWSGISLGLYVLSAVIALGLTIACWKRGESKPLALRYSALLMATVLVAPHLTVYDLVILAPAFLLLADWLVGQERTAVTKRPGTLLYLAYMLPLLGPLTRWTHFQLSVLAMAAVLYAVWEISREAHGTLQESSPANVKSF